MKKQPPVWWKRALRTIGLAVVLFILFFLGFIVFFENSFIYFPTKGDVGPSPGEDVFLTTSDGLKIHGWYVTHPEARHSILYFHGNAGNLKGRGGMIGQLQDLPANVLAIDYRGYGRSEGTPDEPGLYLDARAAYDWLAERADPSTIIVYGKSLGGGPACEIAATVPCGGLILESAFSSAPDMAYRVMPLFPARYFMKTKFDNASKVATLKIPKLFMHSRNDEVIPFVLAERLYAAASEPKEESWFDSGGHNDVAYHNAKSYFERVRKFISGISPKGP